MTASVRSVLLLVFLTTGLAYGLWAPPHHWWLWLATWLGAWLLTALILWVRSRQAHHNLVWREPSNAAAEWLHEIRTPLTHVGLYLSQLRGLVPDASQNTVDALAAELERVHALLESLSVLSRDHQAPEAAPLPWGQWLEPALSLYREVAATLDHALVIDLQAVAPIRGREAEMRQILANVLSNAFRYALPQSPITVTLAADGPLWVQLTVRNPSHDIAATPESLLQPFVHGSSDGSGLGLAVVDRLMRGMNGRVHISCYDGEFIIRLLWPRVQESHVAM